MNARYLVRLDDACDTMSATRWTRMEAVLHDLGVRPIVAIVPENRDPVLQVDPPDASFWEKVRSWQAKGWTIAMHGYQHSFHAVDRKELILPFYDRSEFGGLPYEEQARKIRASWSLFAANGVCPSTWVAPAHCFDRTTLRAIEAETPIRVVSDGIARDQFFEGGFHWIPQQLWAYAPRRTGLWTICLHPNSMSLQDIDRLHAELRPLARTGGFVGLQDLPLATRQRSVTDRAYATWFWQCSRVHSAIAKIRTSRSRPRDAT